MLAQAHKFADVAELADAQVSEACGGNIVEVQVLSSAPNKRIASRFRLAFLFATRTPLAVFWYQEPENKPTQGRTKDEF